MTTDSSAAGNREQWKHIILKRQMCFIKIHCNHCQGNKSKYFRNEGLIGKTVFFFHFFIHFTWNMDIVLFSWALTVSYWKKTWEFFWFNTCLTYDYFYLNMSFFVQSTMQMRRKKTCLNQKYQIWVVKLWHVNLNPNSLWVCLSLAVLESFPSTKVQTSANWLWSSLG